MMKQEPKVGDQVWAVWYDQSGFGPLYESIRVMCVKVKFVHNSGVVRTAGSTFTGINDTKGRYHHWDDLFASEAQANISARRMIKQAIIHAERLARHRQRVVIKLKKMLVDLQT